jgi:hypothetical protein
MTYAYYKVNPRSLHQYLVQIFSTPCPQSPSVYVPLLLSETMFHTHREPQPNDWLSIIRSNMGQLC